MPDIKEDLAKRPGWTEHTFCEGSKSLHTFRYVRREKRSYYVCETCGFMASKEDLKEATD